MLEQFVVSRIVDIDILMQIWKNRVKQINFVLEWNICTSSPFSSKICGGRGGRVVKISDRGWPYLEFELSTTKDPPCRDMKQVKYVESSKVLPLVWCEKIELREDLKSRRGLAVSIEIICHTTVENRRAQWSSKISNKCYDINLRLTYGMRAIGKGGAAARIFCGLMNLPPPPAKFECHNSMFLNVLKTISEDSMNAAVHEAVIAIDNNSNIAVTGDGT
ncbi:uncharacterized protein TNCV_341071 [Trichonephila clavipes]|uniref:Mutator-like transposase domain-containing protein n=1 Tax=Trichonephila clavipes TaxID=2585209 RepID=A0A8X6VPC5_TRICX|nr:uncharacterized protein TNCV_341071 [Trichonephila clavipes]